jgi:hypothetical protein
LIVIGFSRSDGNCDTVLEKTPQLLHAAFGVGFVASFAMLLFSCISCGSVCCPAQCCGPAEEGDRQGDDLKDPLQADQQHHGRGGDSSSSASAGGGVHVVMAEPVEEDPNLTKSNYV